MARKTIEVETVVNYANAALSARGGTQEFRNGVITFAEILLFKSKAYKGFLYLGQDEVGKDDKPGIRYVKDENGLTGDADFTNTDPTRRKYVL